MRRRSQRTPSATACLLSVADDTITTILSWSISYNTHGWFVPEPPPLLHEVCKRFRDIFRKDVIWKLICGILGIAIAEGRPKRKIGICSYKLAYSKFLLDKLKSNQICSDKNEFGKAHHTNELTIRYAGCLAEYERLFCHVIQMHSLTKLDMSRW